MTNSDYSPISSLAVWSALFGLASTLGLLTPALAVLAFPAIALGILALTAVRKYELHGQQLALLGISFATIFLLATPLWHVARFRAEGLSGYERLDFFSIAGKSADSLEPWLGRQVCLKGYAWRPSQSLVLNHFVMSPDGDEGQPKSAVAVQLPPGRLWYWQHSALAVSGNLVKNPAHQYDSTAPKFLLKFSTVRNSQTPYEIVGRAPRNGFGRTPGNGC